MRHALFVELPARQKSCCRFQGQSVQHPQYQHLADEADGDVPNHWFPCSFRPLRLCPSPGCFLRFSFSTVDKSPSDFLAAGLVTSPAQRGRSDAVAAGRGPPTGRFSLLG
jgi:hypothetical protein